MHRLHGSRLPLAPGALAFAPDRAGLYLVSLPTPQGIRVRRTGWF